MTFREKIQIIDVTKLSDKGKNAFEKIKMLYKEDADKASQILDTLIKNATSQKKDIFKKAKTPKKKEKNEFQRAGEILHSKKVRGGAWEYPEEERKRAAKTLTKANTASTRAINRRVELYRDKAKGYAGLGATSPKIGFKALANKVAARYEGKAVPTKYQSQYGKRYSKSEAKEVGNKVAAKVYRLQKGMKGVDETPYFCD